jgi:hypothetical protein
VLDQFGTNAPALSGSPGGTGSPLTVTTDNTVAITIGGTGRGISVTSLGGNGAVGVGNGGNGGNGGDGGIISITNAGTITSPGDSSVGIVAFTGGGNGASGLFGSLGNAGNGGAISITNVGATP